ncbi:hypothetical protein [Patulibacter defluvii]|uniref:hypothetical protein n=1 Tax=Patulibacter defluvii TaxID=3095358 RepID=UPI002A75497D|nr:hypothetical protein [Patulibacter sp. DM4]
MNSRRRTATAIHDLRRTIDCLPLSTRQAMLEGVRRDPIIVGAYTDGQGGVCPMLSAHRRGGRTSFLAFARTWDRFTAAPSRGSRPATPRELRILERHLEASIAATIDEGSSAPLSDVIAEHQDLVETRRRSVRRQRALGEQPSLAEAIAAHRASADRTALDREHEVEPEVEVEVVRAPAPRRRRGGAVRLPEWMRPIGSLEDYEAALAEVDRQRVRLGLVDDTAGPRDRQPATR